MKYQELPLKPDLPLIQEELLSYWNSDDTFQKSVDNRSKEVVFYDGPPFPTGTPHHGTVLVSFIKDMIARYWTMRGFSVPRVWGWDCHGLPIENQAEKKLNLTDKSVIERSISMETAERASTTCTVSEDGHPSKTINEIWLKAIEKAARKKETAGDAFSGMHLGISAFNDACLDIVSTNNESWRDYIEKMARWVDYDHAYKTMSASFMESVMWAFKKCYNKGLIYRGYRVTPYCMHCETSLSISDTRESDSTRPRQDRWVIATFKSLSEDSVEGKQVYYLAWTTTPWTLPSNLALAVNRDLVYAYVDMGDRVYVACENTLQNYKNLFGDHPNIILRRKGDQLLGFQYEPVFSYFSFMREKGAFRIVDADYVASDEGVGIVHTAPAFGEDDYWTCRRKGIPTDIVNPVDAKGRFTEEVRDFYDDCKNKNVIEMNPIIIRYLYDNGKVVADGTIVHNYPHCWRCKRPLIYKAMSAWYFKIGDTRENLRISGFDISDEEMSRNDIYSDDFFKHYGVKEALIDANKSINWIPETVKYGRFGNWVENARDWNISRNRYWSTPIPIWECDCCGKRTVLGSIEEIKKYSGVELTDLHRQFMDQISFPCNCGGVNHRVQEVLDCWFESGSVTYAQKHYPFDNKEWFETHFPCDFIVEYTGQIRCWFYYMHVMSVALFGKPAFKNCIVHGTLLADDGKKFSKSSKNYTDPMSLMNTLGTDPFRLYLYQSNSMLMGDSKFDDSGIKDAFQQFIAPLWNACNFFIPLANSDGYVGDENAVPISDNILDRWILAKLYQTESVIRKNMDSYLVDGYVAPLSSFIDGMTNWYIRRSRRRFWSEGDNADKQAAYNTLYYVLVSTIKLFAPVAPYLAEKLYIILTGNESVHLANWPLIPSAFKNDELLSSVDLVRKVIRLARSIREKQNVKNRQPLLLMQIACSDADKRSILTSFCDIIREELNVKAVELIDNASEIASVVYKPCFPAINQLYPSEKGIIIRAIQTGAFSVVDDGVMIEYEADHSRIYDSSILLISYNAKKGVYVAAEEGIVVSLDLTITDELRDEGFAREIVRNIQDARKAIGCKITDRILISITGDVPVSWLQYICQETLSSLGTISDPESSITVTSNKQSVTVLISLS